MERFRRPEISTPLIFIHIPKTGGSSVTEGLRTSHWRTNLVGGWPMHAPASEVHHRIGDQTWSQGFAFTVVRNPFDRLRSLFWELVCRYGQAEYNPASFREWVTRREKTFISGTRIVHRASQLTWIDEPVDCLLRQEHLAEDFQGCFGVEVPRTRVSPDPRPRAQWYDAATRDFVEQNFSRELELLGYSFED